MFQNTNTYETLPTSPQSADGNGRRLEPWPSQKIIVTGINKKTKCCIATSILLVLITGLALGAVAAFAVITYLDVLRLQARITQLDNALSSVEPTDDGTVMEDIDYLMQTLMNLELQLNSTDKRYSDQLELVSSNLTKLETLQATVDGIDISGQLQDLWLFVRTVNSTQNVLSNQLKNISMATDMFITKNNAELSDLQSSVNDLTNRLNTSTDLYQDCINETESCTLATNESSSSYHEECATPTLPITRNVSHMMSHATLVHTSIMCLHYVTTHPHALTPTHLHTLSGFAHH